MAVGAEEAQAIVTSKQLLKDNGLALYMGTLALGSEYAAGGDTLATDPNSRYSLPEKLDFMLIGSGAGGYDLEYVPGATPKVKAYVTAAAAKEPSQEVAAKKDLKAVAKAQFMAVGLA
jgi:hypothetical protein